MKKDDKEEKLSIYKKAMAILIDRLDLKLDHDDNALIYSSYGAGNAGENVEEFDNDEFEVLKKVNIPKYEGND